MSEWPTTQSNDGVAVADLTASDVVIRRPADVLDLFGAGLQRFVIDARQLPDEFFDLSTGFAGEVLQKCSNYGLRAAVVGDYEAGRSISFRQFASESNRGKSFVFVASVEEGIARLTS